MRVLHYTPRFSVRSETFIYDQITGLDKSTPHQIKVVTSQTLNIAERPFDDIDEIPLRFDLHPRVTRKLAFGFEWLAFFIDYNKWATVITAFKPDVIHCHTGHGIKTVIHVLDKLKLKIPILASLHGSDVTMEPLIAPQYKNVLLKASERHIIHWTVPSEFLKFQAQFKIGIEANNISVIFNAYNPIFLKSKSKAVQSYKILSIGRFIQCKGQAVLIEAFSQATKKIDGLTMTLVGQGPELENCRQLANDLHVTNNIEFISSIPHEEIPILIQQHELYIQASKKDKQTEQEESFGVAALEALVCGIPVAVSNSGGLPEVISGIEPPNAYSFEQDNAAALAQVITTHFLNVRAFNDTVVEQVKVKFSQSANLTKITDLYSQLTRSLSPSR